MATSVSASVDQLRQAPNNLWYRLHVFIYDLRHFRENVASRTRLECIVDISYLSTPYFTAEEVVQLKATVVGNEQNTLEQTIEHTLNERLERRMTKRAESGDYRVCAAHDLAPIFEKAFGIHEKQLRKDKSFLALVEQYGLTLADGQSFTGVEKNNTRPTRQKRKT